LSKVKTEEIVLALVKLERETGNYEKARDLLKNARKDYEHNPRIWMQSIQLEREQGLTKEAILLCKEALLKEKIKEFFQNLADFSTIKRK